MSEGIHWYASSRTAELLPVLAGDAVVNVPKVGGGLTDRITKIHVAKYGLVAGCTAICGMINKPALVTWAENNCIEAAVAHTPGKDRSLAQQYHANEIDLDAFKRGCKDIKEAVGKKAADGGNVIHAQLEGDIKAGALFTSSNPYTKLAAYELKTKVIEPMEADGWKATDFIAEGSFVDEERWFAGRTDLLIRFERIVPDGTKEEHYHVCDFKTREFEAGDAIKAKTGLDRGNKTFGRLTPRDTEPMQIAANIQGQGGSVGFDSGSNLYLSRTQSEVGFLLPYTNEQLETGWENFLACLTLFLNFKAS